MRYGPSVNRALVLLLTFLLTACRSGAPASGLSGPAQTTTSRPIVILVSLDGWRHDYFDRFQPPNLERLASSGVRASGLIPQFPSKTFPNHYTIVTGLRLANHGIVSNNIVSPEIPGRFSMSNRDAVRDPRWWGGEPIWNTAERQGRIAAAMFWPGSEAPVNGRYATYWLPYEDLLPHRNRVNKVLEWLALPPEKRPSFVTLYLSDVDNAGHKVGPEAKDNTEVGDAVQKVDATLGELVAGVEALGLQALVNYVIVSDHGMSQLSPDRMIRLDDYIDTSKFDVIDAGPVLAIAPKDGDVEGLYRALARKHPRMAVYRKADLPRRFELSESPRVLPIMAIADDGWYITTKREMERWATSGTSSGGAHGYDPANRSMHGLFIASGPGVRGGGRVVGAFENIHVYDFMCALLGIQPARNDGDPRVTRKLLR
jgi:predicted AlkP superfamily pyrophosphatase or phosphodiesterase